MTTSFKLFFQEKSVLFSFCLIFSQFQPGVAYKSVSYKKACILTYLTALIRKFMLCLEFHNICHKTSCEFL